MPSPYPKTNDILQGVEFKAPIADNAAHILSAEAIAFLATLHRSFNGTRLQLLQNRKLAQKERDAGKLPDFLPETKHIREDQTWVGPPLSPGLEDRRVEITGPTDRKMVINALNSKVATYMADFEDSSTPTWFNATDGQVNLYDAIRQTIELKSPKKTYQLDLSNDRKLPTLIVRPRGWHLNEYHLWIDGEPISGSLFDFGLYFFNNAKESIARGVGPYFYLPKMEHHLEAKLWNDVFNFSEDYIRISRGTIRATVLIETLPAVFQLDEIIFQLRNHSSGLNCGRWDYIFSYIKSLRNHPSFILPDRAQVNMSVGFMDSYVKRLIYTCHKRQVHAMGGMAALIPIKNDPIANKKAMESVYKDKLREVLAGHDGTWIAHPAIADIALDVFNKYMPGPNQINITRNETAALAVSNNSLLSPFVSGGKVTEKGVRANISIGLGYIEAWLRGTGCVAINFLMEDAATAEVSRSQLNQWVKHGVYTDEGVLIDKRYVSRLLDEEVEKLISNAPRGHKYKEATKFYKPEITDEKYSDFITLPLYEEITKQTATRSINAQKL
ncbi:hypothetical protein DASC09_033180 [Saccharomycopsis crataegensis]|uniref:Malate synthase n=1 Tax=Saccharomycopsis crataegensis TaxID=43959 RepID=A0AAV5QMI8_9ASCO|nr:hypothetical protein DASC09_033180 [Saccharomycopsis crataegensis]